MTNISQLGFARKPFVKHFLSKFGGPHVVHINVDRHSWCWVLVALLFELSRKS